MNTSQDETRTPQKNTRSGAQSGTIRLPDLPYLKLGPEGEQDAFHASHTEFRAFLETIAPVEDAVWTWPERADILNKLIAWRLLRISLEDRLLPVNLEENSGDDVQPKTEEEGEGAGTL